MAEAGGTPQYESKSEKVTRLPQIIGLLRRLHDSRSLLRATLRGSEQTFNTVLLEVDAERGRISLDELNSTLGQKLVETDRHLRVTGQHQGVQISFECDVSIQRDAEGLIYYRAALPRQIDYLQRRAYFRVPVAMAMGLSVRLPLAEDRVIEGQLRDLSMCGLGALLETTDNLRRGLLVPDCSLLLPRQEPITGALEIRYATQQEGNRFTHVGARFVNLEKPQEHRLRRLVTQLEREMLRRKTRD
ncbi:flagellar brake protein [Thiohalobacter sp. IOR34]|uniref:flagellar brake protein n=1 Tax=Thiohalobacter sp. IOR34 TaxID=3057176 RepID=UPI0025B03BDF|nr:flagellar brake protein [Thiohalobacter sp. IOR34]WJW74620.1 flagellar brake protein [Thiohalobacter sp. IOR34]